MALDLLSFCYSAISDTALAQIVTHPLGGDVAINANSIECVLINLNKNRIVDGSFMSISVENNMSTSHFLILKCTVHVY